MGNDVRRSSKTALWTSMSTSPIFTTGSHNISFARVAYTTYGYFAIGYGVFKATRVFLLLFDDFKRIS